MIFYKNICFFSSSYSTFISLPSPVVPMLPSCISWGYLHIIFLCIFQDICVLHCDICLFDQDILQQFPCICLSSTHLAAICSNQEYMRFALRKDLCLCVSVWVCVCLCLCPCLLVCSHHNISTDLAAICSSQEYMRFALRKDLCRKLSLSCFFLRRRLLSLPSVVDCYSYHITYHKSHIIHHISYIIYHISYIIYHILYHIYSSYDASSASLLLLIVIHIV